MISEIRDDFLRGIDKIKWFSRVLSLRLKIEVSIIKLLYQSDEIGRRKDALLLSIGKRVYEFKGSPDKNILKDRSVMEAIAEIETIEKEVVELNRKISELGRAGA